MKSLRNAGRNIRVIGELFSFFCTNKHWWLVPVLALLVLLAALIALAQTPGVGPFIYTLF